MMAAVVTDTGARERAAAFCRRFGLRVPILMAPMAGACPVGLAVAVANAGGMGGLGALMTSPDGIDAWASVADIHGARRSSVGGPGGRQLRSLDRAADRRRGHARHR